MYNSTTLEQKNDYIHNNPVRKKLCQSDIEYKYSSAKYYNGLGDEFGILTHYKEHF